MKNFQNECACLAGFDRDRVGHNAVCLKIVLTMREAGLLGVAISLGSRWFVMVVMEALK